MISKLPKKLTIADVSYKINSNFRQCFNIMQIFERSDITDAEKLVVMVGVLYKDNIPLEHLNEAIDKAVWFLNGGGCGSKNTNVNYGRLMSWKQDEQYILSAVNLTLGISCRSVSYLHWWDFIDALMECKECTFTTLVHQRKLKKQGKQTKIDKEWWAENKDIAEIKAEINLSSEEQAALDKFNKLLG